MKININQLNDKAIEQLYKLVLEKILNSPDYNSDPNFRYGVLQNLLIGILEEVESDDGFGTQGLSYFLGFV